MTDQPDRTGGDGYYGCSLPPGACECPQSSRHKCRHRGRWVATRDAAEGADWQLVPKEPTKEMIQACIWALDRWREKHGNVQGFVPPGDKYQVRWRAMLAVAPAAPVPSPDGADEHGIQCNLCGETLHDNEICDDAECPIGGSFTVHHPSGAGAAEPVATPQQVQEACAQVADRFVARDVEWGKGHPDDSIICDHRAERGRAIAGAIRALIPPVATPPVRGDRGATLDHRVIPGREDWFLLAHELSEARDAYLNGMGQQGSAARRMRLEEILWNDKGTFIQVLQAMSLPVQPGAGEREAIRRIIMERSTLGGMAAGAIADAILSIHRTTIPASTPVRSS